MRPVAPPVHEFAGTYTVKGTTPAGEEYSGTMQIERKGTFLHAAADLGALGTRYGLAIPFSGRLVMAFGEKDKVEIGAYLLEGKTVHGLWVPPGAADADYGNCGYEESVADAPGVWTIRSAIAIDGSKYHGTVRLDPPAWATSAVRPTVVKMTWNLHDGDYHSFGLAYEDAVYATFNLAAGQPNGVAVYAIGGDALDGVWIAGGQDDLGTETLRRTS